MNSTTPSQLLSCYCSDCYPCRSLRILATALINTRLESVSTDEAYKASLPTRKLLSMLIWAHRSNACRKNNHKLSVDWTVYHDSGIDFLRAFTSPGVIHYKDRNPHERSDYSA